MKIRWLKRAPGVYESDSGRFAIHKSDPGWYGREEWVVFDTLHESGEVPIAAPNSLKRAKMVVDDILTSEEAPENA